jgi:hypothetical protein
MVAGCVLVYLNFTAGTAAAQSTESAGDQESVFLRISLGNQYLNNRNVSQAYGILFAVIVACFLLMMINMHEDWKLLKERTIRLTAANYSVRIRDHPDRLSVRRLAEWLIKYFGPLESIVVVDEAGVRRLGVCEKCIDFLNRKFRATVRSNRVVEDPLLPRSAAESDADAKRHAQSSARFSSASAGNDPLAKAKAQENLERQRRRSSDGEEAGGEAGVGAGAGEGEMGEGAPLAAPSPALPAVNADHFHEVLRPQMVIATFMNSADSDKCIFFHRRNLLSRIVPCWLSERGFFNCGPPLFYGRRLTVTLPREPSDIFWRNYAASGAAVRSLASLVVTGALMVVYFFVLRGVQQSRKESGLGTGASLGIGIGLSLLNLVTEYIFLSFTLLERHRSKSGMQLSMIFKKLIVELLNNVVILLLVFELPTASGFTGTDWYRSGGNVVTSLLIADTFIPFFVRIFHPFHRLRKCAARLFVRDQARLNEAFVPKLSIYNNFITFVGTLTWVFFYSPVLPIALPLSFIKLLFLYWVEKYNLLRRYGRPDMIDDQTAAFMLQVIPYTLIATCGFAVVGLRSQQSIFDAFDYRDENNNSPQRVAIAVTYLVLALIIGGKVIANVLATFLGLRFFQTQRATRYRADCCWRVLRNSYFHSRNEVPFSSVPDIESYLTEGGDMRIEVEAAPMPVVPEDGDGAPGESSKNLIAASSGRVSVADAGQRRGSFA